ncbi:hypothetical protein EXIGLDRAFT_399843 [Exidia glandulosa HHB12029]|uniref:Uncharacterized protein n=1 Tax=Exidia glandulosa HHB12029 TaxID=1314781 RepID=A0A165KTB1_EXIGL|nr:hypothetical protein EXIGLDRAFT_399843 [Exidia glandulosa HHB12029]
MDLLPPLKHISDDIQPLEGSSDDLVPTLVPSNFPSLFRGGANGRRYTPTHEGMCGALLVLHNNSDGFGQNIETEGPGSSLNGAIGCASSAAASLHRRHPHLLDHVV